MAEIFSSCTMIWADKLTLFIWGTLVALTFFCIPDLINDPNIIAKIIPTITHFALPLWLLLRVIDWLIGNPGRRKRRASYNTSAIREFPSRPTSKVVDVGGQAITITTR
jgi:hypothetical protein